MCLVVDREGERYSLQALMVVREEVGKFNVTADNTPVEPSVIKCLINLPCTTQGNLVVVKLNSFRL